jgi:ferrous iron transport protein B
LFNALTGLKQKVGNFPGVTVDKKTGLCKLSENTIANFIDLPGSYSLYPRTEDEWVAYKVLLQQDASIRPDMIVVVADASNLRRNLLFCSQIIDLQLPVVVALTMNDIAREKGIEINISGLEEEFGVPMVAVNPRKQKGLELLKKTILSSQEKNPHEFLYSSMLAPRALEAVRKLIPGTNNYTALHYLINHQQLELDHEYHSRLEKIRAEEKFNPTKTQAEEILQRYARIKHVMHLHVKESDPMKSSAFTEKLDKILLHRFWGYAILIGVLFLVFQSVFLIAQFPMNWIDQLFGAMNGWLLQTIPAGWGTDLLVNGFLAGLSGILVFVPQIMLLFGLITLLEDSGYMARISLLSDRTMRKSGLNGKSVMPMISGFACAVPAIMSARSIENKKERLLTILITPLMSCSARLPVFTILISLVIPNDIYGGVISLQGLVMTGLYLFGILMAMLVARVLKYFIKTKERSFFLMELPTYKSPRWKNMFYTMYEKARIFVRDAGKIIMVISLLLWALSHYGPGNDQQKIKEDYAVKIQNQPSQKTALKNEEAALLLEHSYAGHLGHAIEPAIRPLGYDWKIGIALITSFAAREVFVGTMATLYSAGEDADENNNTLQEKMRSAVRADGSKVYTLPTGLSLLMFYLLAMQCMSTFAVVRRETQSWKWPIIQFVYMTALAYLCSMGIYQIFS